MSYDVIRGHTKAKTAVKRSQLQFHNGGNFHADFSCTYRHSVRIFPTDLVALGPPLLEGMVFLEQELHVCTKFAIILN